MRFEYLFVKINNFAIFKRAACLSNFGKDIQAWWSNRVVN